MSAVYPSLESSEYQAGFRAAVSAIDDLVRLFDARDVQGHPGAPLDDATVHALDEVIGCYNDVLQQVDTLGSYIYAFVATDSRDELAQARLSEFEQRQIPLAQLWPRFTAWVGSLDVDALIARSNVARDHEYLLRYCAVQATHLMSPPEEALAAELHVTGGGAWTKLHGNLTSQILVRFEREEDTDELPMSAVRNLAFDPDPAVRRRAYEAELSAWRAAAVPLAAALNSIKGETNTLLKRRGWDSALDLAVLQNHIDRPSLDAMMQATRESFPDFRRYLRAKARLLGHDALPWSDLFAPIGAAPRSWRYEEAADLIVSQFGTYSDRLSDCAARAFRERWIDAEPRPGKVGGAFCIPLRGDESRILSNYSPSYSGVSTLAHELGHAYHNLNLARRTMLQRGTPSTLAETASIFCETIIRNAALRQADPAEQVAILESSLQDSTQVVVDIASRFLFEQRVFEVRAAHELSVDDFSRLMLDAQRETYGDGLDQDSLHPFMWAVKGHYYSAGGPFYNFPYLFGLLFGLGLSARSQQDPVGFRAGYDELLSATGLADAATLAARFGIDIRSVEFWRSSLALIRADIDRFVETASTIGI